MQKLTFMTTQKNFGRHSVLIVKACDSEGEVFKVENDESSNDWAFHDHTDCIRNFLKSGYKEVDYVK